MASVACKLLKFDGVDDTVAFADDATYDVASALSVHMWYLRDYADSDTSVLLSAASRLIVAHEGNLLKVTVSGVTPVYFTKGFPRQVVHCVSIVIYEVGTDLVFELYSKGELYETKIVTTVTTSVASRVAHCGSRGACLSCL
jgi:hypothetical protein